MLGWEALLLGGLIPLLSAWAEFLKTCHLSGWPVQVGVLVGGLAVGAVAGLQAHQGWQLGAVSGFCQVLAALGLYHWSGANRNAKMAKP